ncbi:MAG TPA: ABC transporter permease [Anaerolineae bacterium]|nr:ABC transporter permease [Anaerolineae bacterium]
MSTYIIRRVLQFIPVLIGVTLFTFVLVRKIPGGPFQSEKGIPPAVMANREAQYHLNWPIWKQFLSYTMGDDVVHLITGDEEALTGTSRGLIRFDFGMSMKYRTRDVADIIRDSFGASAQLGIMSLIVGLVIGIPAGTIAALRQNTWIDYTSTFAAVFFLSIPTLVLGPAMIWLFSLKLDLLPVAGWGAKPPFTFLIFPQMSDIDLDYFKLAFMPVFSLGTGVSAGIARLTRASLLQVIREDYIRTARSKGLQERTVIVVHALKNSLIPVVTVLGPAFAGLVTGSFVTERIFGINGLGEHFIASISNRDYSVLMAVTLLYAILLVTANLLVDISYGFLDPRIRFD